MDFFTQFLDNFWNFSTLISLYILLGVIIAGIIKQFIPDNFIQKHIGSNSISSIIKAAILGTPLPLCSCSVIPFATSLRKSGASKSSLQTFLISTPITGVDSIMATYGAFGWFFTLYRLITSIFIAILAGILSIIFIKDKKESKLFYKWSLNPPKIKPNMIFRSNNSDPFLKRVYKYAFEELFADLAKPLFIGIVLGAFLSTLIPPNMTTFFNNNLLLSYMIVLAISIPLYVCAITSIPIGITLILTGFSPGAAFIFLTAGPATNIVTISVVKKILGTKSVIIYLSSVILGTIIFAFLMDIYLVEYIKEIHKKVSSVEKTTLLEAFSALLMYILFYKFIFFKKKNHPNCCG